MQITEEQWQLAHHLLQLRKQLGGGHFTGTDVERLAACIARRTWRERELTAATIH